MVGAVLWGTRADAVQLVARRGGKTFWVSEGATGDPETHAFGWRDAMDIVVKWRQLSEPNDQVCLARRV